MKAKILLVVLGLIALGLGPSAVAGAGGAEISKGSFAPVPGHGDFGITGTARLVRTRSDKTIVQVHLEGLDAGETYPAHLHNAPCASGGGGHYQDQVGGATTPPNELWPASGGNASGITANPAGRGNGKGKADWRARPEAESIVIHHYADASIRVACAQLS